MVLIFFKTLISGVWIGHSNYGTHFEKLLEKKLKLIDNTISNQKSGGKIFIKLSVLKWIKYGLASILLFIPALGHGDTSPWFEVADTSCCVTYFGLV